MTVTLMDGVIVDDTTDAKLRTAKLGTRPDSPTALTQTYSTTVTTVAAPPATTAATQTSPWGYATQAQADAVTAYLTTLAGLVNSIIDALQTQGIMA